MFVNLLKDDMRAVWRKWKLVLLGLIGAGLLSGWGYRIVFFAGEIPTKSSFVAWIGVALALLGVLAYLVFCCISVYVVFRCFYKSFFSASGYLTFAIPTSRGVLLLAKTVNAMLFFLAQTLTAVWWASFLLNALPAEVTEEVYLMVSEELQGRVSVLYLLIGLLLVLFDILLSVNLMHFCITFSCLRAVGSPAVEGVVVYLLLCIPIGAAEFGIRFLLSEAVTSGFWGLLAPERASVLALLLTCMLVGAAAYVLFHLTKGMLDKRLALKK